MLKPTQIKLVKGDITKLTDVDAIVNAPTTAFLVVAVWTAPFTERRDRNC